MGWKQKEKRQDAASTILLPLVHLLQWDIQFFGAGDYKAAIPDYILRTPVCPYCGD
jgi:hypothetical protein